jgi:hypothetical protein
MKELLMKKGMTFWLGHLSALLLAVAMVLTLPFAIAARDLGAVLFSPQRVHAILETGLIESGAFDRILARTLFEDLATGGGGEWYRLATEHLSEPERLELLQLLVPSGWVQDQIGSLSDSLFTWLQSDQPEPEFTLDLRPIKNQLLGESLDLAVEIFIDSWPSCTPEEAAMLEQAFNRDGSFPDVVCEPPEPMRRSMVDLATRLLAAETSGMPDRISLIDQGSINLQEMQVVKNSLRRTRALLAWSWLVPIAALGPIMALKVRSLEDLGRWWGVPLFFTGISTLILNLVFRGSQATMVNQFLADAGAPGSIQFELLAPLFEGAIGRVLRLMLFHALIVAFVGAGAWIGFARRRREDGGQFDPKEDGPVDTGRQEPLQASDRGAGTPPPIPPIDDDETESQDGGPPSGIFG